MYNMNDFKNLEVIIIENNSGTFTARVRAYKVLNCNTGKFVVDFISYNHADTDIKGAKGTGSKVYDTYEKAVNAAKRYVRKHFKD